MRHPGFQVSVRSLMALTALSAGVFVLLRRSHPFALLAACVTAALVGSFRGRSMGRSALICGLGAGVAVAVASEAGEVAYDHKAVVQLLNVAGTPPGWAIIGGFVGLTGWFAGRLIGWPAKREG
jgi:hypothetical protein